MFGDEKKSDSLKWDSALNFGSTHPAGPRLTINLPCDYVFFAVVSVVQNR